MAARLRTAVAVGVCLLLVAAGLSNAGPGINAGSVDGFHAIGATDKAGKRSNKLVAANGKGRLPNNIIKKAPDAARLGGIRAAAFARGRANVIQRSVHIAPGSSPRLLWEFLNFEITYECPADLFGSDTLLLFNRHQTRFVYTVLQFMNGAYQAQGFGPMGGVGGPMAANGGRVWVQGEVSGRSFVVEISSAAPEFDYCQVTTSSTVER